MVLAIISIAAAVGRWRGHSLPDGISGAAHVIDGDSLRVGGHEIRLQGIDAPEGRQECTRDGAPWPCGREAARRLRVIIGRGQVSCQARKRDQHQRVLAVCTVDGRDINRQMVAEGWAVSYGAYRAEEEAARRARRGIWSGAFDRPRDWRARHMSR